MDQVYTAQSQVQSLMFDRWLMEGHGRAYKVINVGTDKLIICWMRTIKGTIRNMYVVEEMETAYAYIEGHGVVNNTIAIGDYAIRHDSIDRIYPHITR